MEIRRLKFLTVTDESGWLSLWTAYFPTKFASYQSGDSLTIGMMSHLICLMLCSHSE